MDRIEQVAAQCRAVSHMATALAEIHEAKSRLFEKGGSAAEDLCDLAGRHTAALMETLGDILNGMDAVDPDEDGWIGPIMLEAQRIWGCQPA